MVTVLLSWSHNDSEVTEDQFRIYRDSDLPVTPTEANQIGTNPADDTTFRDERTSVGTYHYAVSAVNVFGESSVSREASIEIDAADPQVEIIDITHSGKAGEPLRVGVEVTNAGDLPATGEVTLSISEQ